MALCTGPRGLFFKVGTALLFVIVALNIYINGSSYRISRPSFRFSLLQSRAKIQYDFGSNTAALAQPERLRAVQAELLHAWKGYREHAWMADSLRPVSGKFRNQFCGWAASLVDALDTLYLMGLDQEFDEAVNATTHIRFNDPANKCKVNLFESTIRYLGSLIAAYDLSHDQRLLPKLVEMGDLLHSAFGTQNGMPCGNCYLMHDDPKMFRSVEMASIAAQGTLSLEFARLSQITGDPKYVQSILHSAAAFARRQNDSTIPGLWPEKINPSTVDTAEEDQFARISWRYTLGASSDSAYEYLVKTHLLLGKQTSVFGDMWRVAAPKLRQFLLFRAMIPEAQETPMLFPGIANRRTDDAEVTIEPRAEHLACFTGGMFGLASRVFNEPEHFAIGRDLTQGCLWAYDHAPLGIMPESFTLLPCPDDNLEQQCAWDSALWAEQTAKSRTVVPGFFRVNSGRYVLRPEAIESVFYMFRLTGDEYWREAGWRMFRSVRRYTRTPLAHSGLINVMEQPAPMRPYESADPFAESSGWTAMQDDEMESFWFAETLKYFWLLFSDPNEVSLDDWVFNTEAHPFRLTEEARGFPSS